MVFLKPKHKPECVDLRLISQRILITENPGRSYIDTHLECNYFKKRILKKDCILCSEYKPLIRVNQ